MDKLFAANWKMHKTRAEARDTAAALAGLCAGKLPAGLRTLHKGENRFRAAPARCSSGSGPPRRR